MGKGGYGLTYQEVYEMENLTIEAKAIYGMLCSYAGSKAMAYPSVDFICDKLKISRTRFYKHMNLLVGAGVVKKEQRKNENQSFSGNVYVLVPNLQNIQMPCTENEYAGNASTGNEETNINTFNINTLKSKTEYREVMEAFNAICVSYPKVKSLSEARKKAIRARLRTYSIDDLRKAFEVLLSTVKGIFNSIKQICSGFITFLKGAFTGNIDMALKGVLGILRGVANLVFSIFKTPVNEVIALFNAMGQTIVKAINNLIDGLNHIKVPDWVPGIGGKGINLSHANFRRVPYLAQGAVIPAGNPFLAVLGDQTRGNNLEMPENLLRKIVSEESGKGTGMIKLVVNLDSRTVLERLINTAKEMQMSNGQNVFELGR